MERPPSEVKGIWFSSLWGYLHETESGAAIQRFVDDLPTDVQSVVRDPLVSQWYPEHAFASVMHSVHGVLACGSDRAFEKLIEGATVHGTGRFFRALLHLTTPAFIVSKIPVLWGRMRRGPGLVRIEASPGRTLVRYSEFPYFDDPVYPLLTVGSIRGVARTAGGRASSVQIVDKTGDALDVEVRFPR